MNQSPGALEELSSRVDELERRVHALEHPGEFHSIATAQVASQSPSGEFEAVSELETGKVFPILGLAMLGIAGAYILRAIAEAGTVSKMPVSALAVAYAFGWLVWSTRVSGSVARVIYAGTSALILAPMLWENTLVFRVFSPVTSAGVLAGYLTLTTVLELRDTTARSMWPAQVLAVLTAASLAFTSRNVLPFVLALLVGVFVSEFARVRDFPQPVWPVFVLAADAAVWGLIFIYAGPQDARVAYPQLVAAALLSPPFLLFTLNGAAFVIRVLLHECRVTVFETIQLIMAFGLAVTATLYFAPVHGSLVLGVLCLLLSACAYAMIFMRLRHRSERRSLRVFGVWSIALLIAGCLWALPASAAADVLAVASVISVCFSRRLEPALLEFHGVSLLAAAALTAKLPQYIYLTAVEAAPHRPALTMLVVSVCAAALLILVSQTAGGMWQSLLHFVPSLLAVGAILALLVNGVLAAAAAVTALDVHHVALLRTLTICAAALAMAFCGSRWKRNHLTWLAYFALALAAAKLLVEDLRHGHMDFIAGSIASFAITLIAVPRLVRLGTRLHAKIDTKLTAHTAR